MKKQERDIRKAESKSIARQLEIESARCAKTAKLAAQNEDYAMALHWQAQTRAYALASITVRNRYTK